jgi:hypothetical protein
VSTENPTSSRIAGVSVRGWIATALVLTVCGMSAAGIEVVEPLYTLSTAAVAYYLGQSKQKSLDQQP